MLIIFFGYRSANMEEVCKILKSKYGYERGFFNGELEYAKHVEKPNIIYIAKDIEDAYRVATLEDGKRDPKMKLVYFYVTEGYAYAEAVIKGKSVKHSMEEYEEDNKDRIAHLKSVYENQYILPNKILHEGKEAVAKWVDRITNNKGYSYIEYDESGVE